MKYACIRRHRDSYPVALMCEELEVSKSGYYDSLDRPLGKRAQRGERIRAAVRAVHAQSHGIYGSDKRDKHEGRSIF